MATDGDLTPGELSRRVQELLLQFEALLRKIEDRYVQKETLELIREGLNNAITGLRETDTSLDRSKAGVTDVSNLKSTVDEKATRLEVENLRALVNEKASSADLKAVSDDVDELKGHNTWLFRVIGMFIVLAILGAVFAAGGGLAQ